MLRKLGEILSQYRQVERHIYYLIGAEFCLQMINSSFFLLLNYFLIKEGYTDYEVAGIIEGRFMAVMMLGAPLGFFIKGKRLKPFFYFAALALPTFSIATIYSAEMHLDFWLDLSVTMWGVAFVSIQVTALPFILLNADERNHSEAISMFFQTMSLSIFICGVLYFVMNRVNPVIFTEKNVLLATALFGYLAVIFIYKITIREQLSVPPQVRPFKKPLDLYFILKDIIRPYDWSLIFKAIIPTILIAVGAGFTIPVINLFFLSVHGVDSDIFSILGAVTYLFVAIGMTFIPVIRRTYGYKVAITLFQSLAIVALLVMATTEYYKHWEFAVFIAVIFYLVRQPLMNVAGPMTSELTLYYVGKRNQEMVSALNASIWSGSWFFSMHMFSILRKMEWRYVSIILITVVFYLFGVIWYAFLIKSYKKRKRAGLYSDPLL